MTETQELLIDGLKIFGVSKREAILLMLRMQDETQMWELMEWMTEHQGATEKEILAVAEKIMTVE